MTPDRNPDGFDGFRRRYVADSLAAAAAAMPIKRQREFRHYLDSLCRDGMAVDPPEPPKPRRARRSAQRSLPLLPLSSAGRVG